MQREQMARDLHLLADAERKRRMSQAKHPTLYVNDTAISLGPVIAIVRAWNRFARRHLPRPVYMTINTGVILFVVLMVVMFVLSLMGH